MKLVARDPHGRASTHVYHTRICRTVESHGRDSYRPARARELAPDHWSECEYCAGLLKSNGRPYESESESESLEDSAERGGEQ